MWQPDAQQQLHACREEVLRVERLTYGRVWEQYLVLSLEDFEAWMRKELYDA